MLEEDFSWLQEAESRQIWHRQKKVDAFALSLQTTAPVTKEAGLEVTELPLAFGFDRMEDPRLITRHNTRRVFNAILEQILHEPLVRRFLVEGAPGIGKSRNLTYLLKLLLCHGKTVLYEDAKGCWVMVFIPSLETAAAPATAVPTTTEEEHPAPSATPAVPPVTYTYRCYRANSRMFREYGGSNALVDSWNAVYLYDPQQVQCYPPDMDCVGVMAASPGLVLLQKFISDRASLVYKINMFTEEEVIAYFDIVRPEHALRSAPAPPDADARSTFDTPVGPVLKEQTLLPLGEEHLRCGYYEIGGSPRYLSDWLVLSDQIARRNVALGYIRDFDKFSYLREAKNLSTSDPDTRYYANTLLTYHNTTDPREDEFNYEAGTEVRAISPGTLLCIGWERYHAMYAHMTELIAEETYPSTKRAVNFFEILARAALAEIPILIVRDLNAAAAAKPATRKSAFLYHLHLDRAAVVPVADTEGRLLSLPGGDSGLQALPSGLLTAIKRTQAMIDAVEMPEYPRTRPATRQLYYSEATCPVLHAFDQRNRGYRFTLSESHVIQYTPVVALLDRLGCSPEQPFHLFLAVPQGRFDTWTRLPTLVRSEAGAVDLTAEEVAAFYERVRVYVVRIPEKRPC